ncbi:MAG TPA: DedA family protein [Candidatus Dormibacteraeota bacterium]|nr:DedA family protein [Candidatus Dormibacteraeota bacterium]
MSLLHAVHGWSALIVLCSLVFVEEAGVPLPMAPGDLLLIGAGVLLSTRALDPVTFLPAVFLASLTGAMVGYTWARAIGRRALWALAERLRAGRHLEMAAERLRNGGPWTILVARLIPGLRINTTLVAGALQVPRRTFLAGLIPAILIWEGVFVGLGAAVGTPVEHYLGRVEHLMLRGAVFVLIGLAGYLAVRHIPIPDTPGEEPPPRRFHALRMVLAVGVDVAAIALIVNGLDSIVDAILGPGRQLNESVQLSLQLAVSVAIYLALSRRLSRTTLGEALFRVTYRARRGPRLRAG